MPIEHGSPTRLPFVPHPILVFIDVLVRELSQIAHAPAFADDVVVWWHAQKGDSGKAVGRQVLVVYKLESDLQPVQVPTHND